MQWLNAQQGKSSALNEALYNTAGKYIINIDSDGLMDPDAIRNTVGDQKDECEYYIDAEQLAKKFNMDANDIQYVEERFGRIGQQWIGTSGASTGPWGSVALCAGIACLGWFLKRRI